MNQLTHTDFLRGEVHRAKREQELQAFQYPAAALYTGLQHQYVMQGLRTLRHRQPQLTVDLFILSAAYGLVPEQKVLTPYELTFNGMGRKKLAQWATTLRILDEANRLVAQYDLVFFLLGDVYLQALNLPLQSRENQTFVVLGGQTHHTAWIQHNARTEIIPLNNTEAQAFSCGVISLKGFLFGKLAAIAAQEPEVLSGWAKEPSLIRLELEAFKQPKGAY